MMEIVDFLWIVPLTETLIDESQDNLAVIDLSRNFRNAREIVKTTRSVADKTGYLCRQAIIMPPTNFPTGCLPSFVESFEDAMKEARKRTKNGVLIAFSIFEDIDYADYLNQTNEKWKMYCSHGNDFKENENPYKFLQEGNVLIVDDIATYGFEWTTVIIIEPRPGMAPGISLHGCNLMMRCTTNLIVIRRNRGIISNLEF